MRKGLLIAFLAIVVAGGAWYYASGQRSSPGRQQVSPTMAIPVQRTSLVRTIAVTGKLTPVREAELVAQSAGRVVTVHTRDGASVEAGELLVTFDETQARLSLLQAQRDYEEARVDSTPGVIEEKRLSLEVARRNFEETKLTAPFAGIVSGFSLLPGDHVGNGAAVAKLIDPSKYQVTVEISERDLRYVSPGQSVIVTVDALPGLRLTGRVDRIGWEPSASSDIVTYPVTVVIDEAPGSLRPGMSTQVDIVIEEARDVLAVPLEAVAEFGPRSFVTRLTPQGAEEAVEVTTGMSDGRFVEIRSGLSEGDRILGNNYALYQSLFEEGAQPASARGGGRPTGGFGPAPSAGAGVVLRGGPVR